MHSVEIKNLDLSFGAVTVLQNLNLSIGQGEFLVLLGSSGCGKSTLLNCIAGLLDVTDGQIFISGKKRRYPALPEGFELRLRPP
jgi:multiple sugar transport system ATP-binding protein